MPLRVCLCPCGAGALSSVLPAGPAGVVVASGRDAPVVGAAREAASLSGGPTGPAAPRSAGPVSSSSGPRPGGVGFVLKRPLIIINNNNQT